MSILIKGVGMPSKCIECRLMRRCGKDDLDYVCMPARVYVEDLTNAYKPRPEYCPLVPVPPHYDLIDHNALKIAVMYYDAETRLDFLKHAMDCINKAPVVIPSDMPTYEAEEGE